MRVTKSIFCVAALLAGTVTAEAGFFDTLNRVAETADRVADAQQDLAKGKLPTSALKGGHEGKHGGKGRRHK